ncbi:MAG TPA: hypothetical protein VKU40_08280 [Thermoanaerobaculia bacterium]|nr:hypothetical protein [Thermoanaerobaculia bacterium]
MSRDRNPPTALTTAAAPPSRARLRSIGLVSLLAGLCPLIPLPFIDDWLESVVRRRAVRDLLRRRGLEPTPGDVEILAGLERPGATGCLKKALLWPLFKLFFYLLKKLYRKILYFLAVNDGVNTASSLFHDAWLLAVALDRGALDVPAGERIDRDRAREVRAAMETVVAGADRRPLERAVRRAFRGSFRALSAAARRLGRWGKSERKATGSGEAAQEQAADDLPVADEERRLSGMVDRLVDAVQLESGYLEGLEERFVALLEEKRDR